MPVYTIKTEPMVFPPEKPDQKIMLMNQGPIRVQYETAADWSDTSPWLAPSKTAVLPAGIQFMARAPTSIGTTYGKLMVARLSIGI